MGLKDNAFQSVHGKWRRPEVSSQLYKDVHDDIMRQQMKESRVGYWPFVRLFMPLVICAGIFMIFDGRWSTVAPFASGVSTVTYFIMAIVFFFQATANATERHVYGDSIARPLVKGWISLVLFSLSLATFVTFALIYS